MKKYNSSVVVILGIMVMALAGRGEAKKVASKACLDGCKPICLNLEGALDTTCDLACTLGCIQLLGKGDRAQLNMQKNKTAGTDAAPSPAAP